MKIARQDPEDAPLSLLFQEKNDSFFVEQKEEAETNDDVKIEAVDDSEIEMIELNESESDTIETTVPGPSNAIILNASENVNSTPKSVNTETSSENLTLSRKRPRSGPEIIDNGGALKITGRSMSCSVCKVHVSAKNKKDRVQTKYCCVSCHEPVCLKKHAQVICFRCFGEK